MDKYDYFEAVREDVIEYIKKNFDLRDYAGRREALKDDIKEDVAYEVSGRYVGSYTCDSPTARKHLEGNEDLIKAAYYCLGEEDKLPSVNGKIVDDEDLIKYIDNPELADVYIRDYVSLSQVEPALKQIEEEQDIDLDDDMTFVNILFKDMSISPKAEFIFEDRENCHMVGCYRIDTPHIEEYANLIVGSDFSDYSYDELIAYVSIYDDESCSIDVRAKEHDINGRIIDNYYSGMDSLMIPTEAEEKMAELLMKEVGADDMHELVSITAAQKEIDYSKINVLFSKSIYLGNECEINGLSISDMIYMLETTGLQSDYMTAADMLKEAESVHLFAAEAGTSTVKVTIELNGENINIQLSDKEANLIQSLLKSGIENLKREHDFSKE